MPKPPLALPVRACQRIIAGSPDHHWYVCGCTVAAALLVCRGILSAPSAHAVLSCNGLDATLGFTRGLSHDDLPA